MQLTRAALTEALLIGVAGVIAACGREGGGMTAPCAVPTFATIPEIDSIPVSDTVRFSVNAPTTSPPRQVVIRWSSSNTSVATISADSGLVRGLSLGRTFISAVDGNATSCVSGWEGTLWVRLLHTLPPDTLPHLAADSALAFSVSGTALYANASMSVTFVFTNPRPDTLRLWGSGDASCMFVVRAYDQSGNVASPILHACPADLFTYTVLPPHATYTIQRTWTASDDRNFSRPPAPLAAGVYDLEPKVEGLGFLWVGKRLKVQVIRP